MNTNINHLPESDTLIYWTSENLVLFGKPTQPTHFSGHLSCEKMYKWNKNETKFRSLPTQSMNLSPDTAVYVYSDCFQPPRSSQPQLPSRWWNQTPECPCQTQQTTSQHEIVIRHANVVTGLHRAARSAVVRWWDIVWHVWARCSHDAHGLFQQSINYIGILLKGCVRIYNDFEFPEFFILRSNRWAK